MKTITKSKIGIELNCDERDILRKAIDILRNVNELIDDSNNEYVTDSIDMRVYNDLYDEINRIEDYIHDERW